MNTLRMALVSSVLCGCLLSTSVHAETSPSYVKWRERAEKLADSQQALPFLEVRQAAADTKGAAERLVLAMRKLDPGLKLDRSDGLQAQLKGLGWAIQVHQDGFAATGHALAPTEKTAPLDERMSIEVLTEKGREFIASYLSQLLEGSLRDELVPAYSYVHVIGGQSPKGGPAEEFVTSNTIVYRRMISGIPVVGPGSRIQVTFSTDGAPTAYEYDWPTVTVGSDPMPTVPVKEQIAKLQLGVSQDRVLPVRELACGYYDAGAGKRADGKLHPGCQVTFEAGRVPLTVAIPTWLGPERPVRVPPRWIPMPNVEIPVDNSKDGAR